MDNPQTSTFLATLVAERRLQPEPVATSALSHLLANSVPARRVISNLAETIDPTQKYEELAYTGQAYQADAGRPDIVGYDSTGWRVVIEAKFDAGLTPQQAGKQYVDTLKDSGVLFYLVPRDRMPAIWPRLLIGPCGQSPETVPPALSSNADEPWLAHTLPDGRVVAALSWQELLRRLHAAIDGGGDPSASADLAQLSGLVEQQTRTGYLPLAPDDLTERAGRQLQGLKLAVLEAAKSVSDKKTSNGSNDWGPARWVNGSDGKQLFWVGLRIPTWGRLGLSPVWAVIVKRDLSELRLVEEALQPLKGDGMPGVFKLDRVTLGIPVRAPLGAEQGTVEESFKSQLKAIRDLMEPLGTSSEVPDPETIETGDGQDS